LSVRASDGLAWGGWSNNFTVSGPVDNGPVVTVSNLTLAHNQKSIAGPGLFVSASDPDGDAVTQYAFFNTGSDGGYFPLNGVNQAVNQEIDVPASQLAGLTYISEAGTDTLWVRAFDGTV
jgi:hypothetical protein